MQLEELGWSSRLARSFTGFSANGHEPARVIEQFNHIYTILDEGGERRAQLSGRLRHEAQASQLPVVGDWVAARSEPGADEAQIVGVLPRATKFSRRAAGRSEREQVVAANIDYAFLVVGLDNDFSPRRVERYLTAALGNGVEPVIVLNKLDLCADPEARRREIAETAQGFATHVVSALAGEGVDGLKAYCRTGQTIALLGSSGVGKSTLINRLLGEQRQATQATRKDGSGRHTTTRRELLFCAGGGMVIDTPGMRELQLWSEDEDLQLTFDEIQELAQGCRFRDCRHEGEPGCAVQAAVDEGRLSPSRLASLHKLQRELARQEMRAEASPELLEKQRWKQIHKSVRRFMKESPKYR